MAAVTSHARPIGTFPTWRSNSGEHLSQPLGCLDESGDGYGQCNPEKRFRASSERAAGQRHDADVLERALLESAHYATPRSVEGHLPTAICFQPMTAEGRWLTASQI